MWCTVNATQEKVSNVGIMGFVLGETQYLSLLSGFLDPGPERAISGRRNAILYVCSTQLEQEVPHQILLS